MDTSGTATGHRRIYAAGGPLVVGGTLLAAVLVLFLPALIHPDYLLYPTFSPHSDLTVIHWPKVHLMAEAWQATGALPLWTPANLSGMPLAANQLAMCFYPPAWLLLALPSGVGFNLFFVLHLWWSGLGVYWLLRRAFDLDRLPALIGGLTFALGGKLLAHLAGGHVSMVAAVAWMPWAFGAAALLMRAPRGPSRLKWAFLAGLALAMQLATHSLILLYTGYLMAAYVVWEMVSRGHTGQGRRLSLLLPLAAIPLTAVLLEAVQLLPLIELAGYSNRALSPEEAGQFALTPLSLPVAMFLPTAQAGHEMVAYLGIVPLLLAVWGLNRSDRRTWFLVAVVVVALILALGPATPVFDVAYRFAPGMRWVRTPARVFFVAALAVAVLAGLGAQRLSRGRAPWSTPAALAVGAVFTAVGVGLAVLYQVNRATLGLALLPLLTLMAIGLAARRRVVPRWALAGLLCLLMGDLLSFGLTMIRFVSPEVAFAEGSQTAEYLDREPGLFRTYSPSYSMPPHVAARAGIQTADGVEPVHLARYDRFMELAGGYGRLAGEGVAPSRFSVTIPPFPPDQPLDQGLRGVTPDLPLLGLMNVDYLAAAFAMQADGLQLLTRLPGTYIYRNLHSLPRAWVLPGDAAAPFLIEADEQGWPQQLLALAEQGVRAGGSGKNTAAVAEYAPDHIVVDAGLSERGVLVLGENWYPGWLAWVDDEPSAVIPISGLLRGVALEPGTHRVVFEYRPLSVRVGVWVSLTAWLALLLAGAVTLTRRMAGTGTRTG